MPHDRKYKIIATRNGPNNYSFRMEDFDKGGPPDLVFNKDTNGMMKQDYYVLEFHLQNEPGCKLEFVDDREKVLSACHEDQAVNGCAPKGSTYYPIFFIHPTKKIGKKLLYVINTDMFAEKFKFAFSFVSPDGEEGFYDPGGENEDRGIGKFDWNYAIVGAISGALAGIGTATLMAREFVPSSALLYGAGGAILGLIIGYLFGRR